jgi:hypothetical protein
MAVVAMAALGVSTASDLPRSDVIDALKACRAMTEGGALSCLDNALPSSWKQRIASAPEREFPYPEFHDALDAVREGFGILPEGDHITLEQHADLKVGQSPVVDDFRKQGLPVSGLFFTAEVYLLESYWLRKNGCRFDRDQRVKITRENNEKRTQELNSFARLSAQGHADKFKWYTPLRLNVSCNGLQEDRH